MTFNPTIATANQTLQLGAETTPGTAVPASKRVDNLAMKFGSKGDFKKTTGTGRKYPSVQQLNSEWVEGSFDGSLDFNTILYALAGALGIATPVAHGSSSTAKDWIYDAILSGSRQPQTYTFEQGEAATRAHKFAYGLITKYGYKYSRKDSSLSGSVLAQKVSDGITMTASPTPVPLLPMTGQEFNLYIDSVAANIGTTQVLNNLSGEFSMDGIYGPAWFVNRANSSFGSHVDLVPNAGFKFAVSGDASGMAYLGDMRTGVTKYARVEALGDVIDNSQTVTIGGGATSGNFTLTYKGQTTANIAYAPTLTSATVQTAYRLLSTVLTNCTVSGPNGGPFVFTYTGPLATDTTAMTATNVTLTGGTPTIVVTQTQVYNTFWHDMAIKIGQPSEWGDSDGIYMIEYDCGIFEDGTWGHSHLTTVTNTLTAL
jgi:hypothetical protein